LNGEHINEVNECGEPVKDDILLLLVNSYWDKIDFVLPNTELSPKWEILINTHNTKNNRELVSGHITIADRSLILLRNLRYK